MGHVRNYSIGDVVARFKKMQGFNVIHPMGFDAFGMPAENAAIQHGIAPVKWTYSNIDNMTRQQKELGLSYDWDRKVLTCSEDYYKHTQKLFEIFYKKDWLTRRKPRSTGATAAIPFLPMNRLKKEMLALQEPCRKERPFPVVPENYSLCRPPSGRP